MLHIRDKEGVECQVSDLKVKELVQTEETQIEGKEKMIPFWTYLRI